MENLDFISLRDFLTLPFINPYSKCIVYNFDNDEVTIGEMRIKDLIADLKAGKYEEHQEEYYVSDVMPGISWDDNKIYHGRYDIYLRSF